MFKKILEAKTKKTKETKKVQKRVITLDLDDISRTWDLLHSTDVPVTYFEKIETVTSDDGTVKENRVYDITILITDDTWDRINRGLGNLGIGVDKTKD